MPRELVAIAPGRAIIREYDDPPLPKGHIRVKVEFGAPKHGTELTLFKGYRKASFPMGLGNMCVGRVVEVGEEVEGFSIGERVAGYGHLRETHIWRADSVWRMPERMSPKEAVCFDPAQFALAGVRDGNIRIGDYVAIFGLGAIGQMAVQMARMSGAIFVAAVDPIPLRRKVALENGADIALDPNEVDVGEELKRATGGRGIDVAIETSGSYEALHQAIRGLSFGGTVSLVGWSKECKGGLDFGETAHFIIPNILFSRACSDPNRDHPRWSFKRIMETCWKLLSEGRFNCENIVQPVVPFSEALEAYLEYVDRHPEKSVKLGVVFEGER